MSRTYDIAIIGAGPAGLNAARMLIPSAGSLSICVFDKHAPWRHPIPCAEGVFKPQFHELIKPQESWIRFLVDKAIFHSPSGATITYQDKNKGYIINRARMQKDIADECASAGIDCQYSKRVIRIRHYSKEGYRTIDFEDGDSANARAVIDCSGPLSSLGKDEPIYAKPMDLEVAYLAHIKAGSIQTDTIHIYAGKNVAPGAYAWAFPRTKRSLNAGVIVGSPFRRKVNVRDLMQKFIDDNFGGAAIEQSFAGTIPCGYGRKILAANGLIKAGDAASTVNPISRAGISEAMLSGALAAKAAVKMAKAQTPKQMKEICKAYTNEWNEARGKRYAKLAKVKNSLAKVPDSDYNKSAETLSAIPLNKLTMSRIFAVSLARFPRLVWALRHIV